VNRSFLGLLTLALPLVGLGGTWAWTHVRAQQGAEWDVPIMGYDPRDLLRGHYIVFRYDWPGLEREVVPSYVTELCLVGNAPAISRTTSHNGNAAFCRNPVRASDGGSDWGRGAGLSGGILYVSQQEAPRLEKKLADPRQQGLVRIRLREDGHITPLRISFRPRPAALPSPAVSVP
jgi:hypothetical protein